jgi:hypothetical protein
MRTTVELPPALMRAAKLRAAAQGESLKTWFTRAVASALGSSTPEPSRTSPWPLFGTPGGKKVRLTNALIADLEAAEDAEKYDRRGRRR